MILGKNKVSLFGRMQERIEDVLLMRPKLDDVLLEELEEVLITSDIGLDTAEKIIEGLKAAIRSNRLKDAHGIKSEIRNITAGMLDKGNRHHMNESYPLVVLVVGVNGSGKTTTIAKLANRYQSMGKSVMLISADTFRAAASEQLSIWGERLSVSVIAHKEGADPSAVVYDGISAAKARAIDVVICDTAGRLQTKKNLMAELSKMSRVIEREYPQAGRETLLVLDATTGKNAVSQAKEFNEASDITGLIITKMDGTAKGGIVVTLADAYDFAVKFIGTGEQIGDLQVFDPASFADNIFMEQENGREI